MHVAERRHQLSGRRIAKQVRVEEELLLPSVKSSIVRSNGRLKKMPPPNRKHELA
jgi:hypothetical protein